MVIDQAKVIFCHETLDLVRLLDGTVQIVGCKLIYCWKCLLVRGDSAKSILLSKLNKNKLNGQNLIKFITYLEGIQRNAYIV